MDLLSSILFDVFITAIAYLFVPLIIFISGKRLELSQIKKVIIINGVCVWLLMMIIRYANGIDGTSYAVVLWSCIGYLLMKKKCLKQTDIKNDICEHINTEDNICEDINAKQARQETLLKSLFDESGECHDISPNTEEMIKSKIYDIFQIDSETPNNKK